MANSPDKSPTVSEDLAKKFSTEKDTPYLRWVRGEGLDIISANYVPSLRTVELKPWTRRGQGFSSTVRRLGTYCALMMSSPSSRTQRR